MSNTLTAYALIKRLNGILSELGFEKVLPTQMGYTYVTKGMVDGIKGNHQVTLEAADKWIAKYLTKNGYIEKTTTNEVLADTDGTVGEW